jgi:hypothetical protein
MKYIHWEELTFSNNHNGNHSKLPCSLQTILPSPRLFIMNSSLILSNILNPHVLFFFLGMLAIFLKSDLEIPVLS